MNENIKKTITDLNNYINILNNRDFSHISLNEIYNSLVIIDTLMLYSCEVVNVNSCDWKLMDRLLDNAFIAYHLEKWRIGRREGSCK